MITKEKLKAVKAEMIRFKKALADLEAEEPNYTYFHGSKQTGRLKRASMDLSNALIDLRRSN